MRLRAPLQQLSVPWSSTACFCRSDSVRPAGSSSTACIQSISRFSAAVGLVRTASIYLGLICSYDLFLYSTPFLIFSMLFSLVYVHIYRKELEQGVGSLPPCPDPLTRDELQLVLGEVQPSTRSASQSDSAMALHPRTRSLYRHRLVRFHRFRQDARPDPAGDAPVVCVSRRRSGAEAFRYRP